jgi:hypothetical protein
MYFYSFGLCWLYIIVDLHMLILCCFYDRYMLLVQLALNFREQIISAIISVKLLNENRTLCSFMFCHTFNTRKHGG